MFETRLKEPVLIEINEELKRVQGRLNEIKTDFENSGRQKNTEGFIKRYRSINLELSKLKEIIIAKIEQAKKKI